MIAVSERLQKIASYVKKGSKAADIGSDHAYLPVFLVQTGKAVSAVAGEVNWGPWQSAKEHVEAAGLADRIDVRLGDGLSVLKDGEADTVCIAGMGGTLICRILESGLHLLPSVQQLILQPNVAERNVREWLYEHGWELIGETILKEDGIIYEVLCAKPGNPEAPYTDGRGSMEQLFEVGPFLWHERSPILKEKWQRERDKTKRVLLGLEKAQSGEVEEKKAAMEKRLEWMEEMLECLQKDNR